MVHVPTVSGPDDFDPKQVREPGVRHIARIGWLAAAGVTLVTGIVLQFVMNTHDPRAPAEVTEESKPGRPAPGPVVESSLALRRDVPVIDRVEPVEPALVELDSFLAEIQRVDFTDENSIKSAKDKIAANRKLWKGSRIEEEVKVWLEKLNGALFSIHRTRSLKEKLSAFEAHLAASPTIEILSKDFSEVRDTELKMQATEAGGDVLARYDAANEEITRRYLEALRTAATAAASGTTGEALAPYGPLEDTIRTLLHEATANKDKEADDRYSPMWKKTYAEVDQIVTKLFDQAYQNKVPWSDLLADDSGWEIISSSSFKPTFGAGLTLVNEPGEQSGSGGLSYRPADQWRDYVLEVEVELDSGTLVFYTRVGDRLDTKEVPGFTVGGENPTIPIQYGRVYHLVITTIGSQMTVTGGGISPYTEDIRPTKSRRGEPGIVAQAGTTATITKLRARHLR